MPLRDPRAASSAQDVELAETVSATRTPERSLPRRVDAVPATLGPEDARRRLLREARASCALTHSSEWMVAF
jgi:hypothetical protein